LVEHALNIMITLFAGLGLELFGLGLFFLEFLLI
jgi:hypothetical protein